MTKILVADDEADFEVLIRQNFDRKSGNMSMNLCLQLMAMMRLIN